MTVNELVDQIADELNVGGNTDARARIGRKLNNVYKMVTSSLGLPPTRRSEVSKAATVGDSFITFTGIEKLEIVYRKVGTNNKKLILDELTSDEMKTATIGSIPKNYTIYSFTQSTITLELDCIPVSPGFTLYATGLVNVSNLSNLDKPALPESFHDILIHGVMASEYLRKNDPQAAKIEDNVFTNRLSDLRMFIAKSGFVTAYRGKHANSEGWWDSTGVGQGD